MTWKLRWVYVGPVWFMVKITKGGDCFVGLFETVQALEAELR
jgi:hypothetical protein